MERPKAEGAPPSEKMPASTLSTEERALRAIEKLKREVAHLKGADLEPIAIVGAACRLPGDVNSLEALWQLLVSGADTLVEIPKSRFSLEGRFSVDQDEEGKTYVKHASLLSDIESFDPGVFGIAPIEAEALDPQQRLLLECVFEGLANAGLSAADVPKKAGVFVGASAIEFALRARGDGGSLKHQPYFWTGTSQYGAANRLSYAFDFKGPSIAADGACASSVVAVHLACQSLRERRVDLAFSGAANALLSAEEMVIASRMHALSPDGRCKTFDASGDGYGRGEGAGMLVLKRVSDALAAGDRILGIVRGTATNHGGHASGFTVPSALAQASLIQEALERGGTAPEDISYVEAHGTGTALGDPIEIEGIRLALASKSRAPLRVGSIKTNIGHLEAAAGVAGILKVLASFRHRELPASLHFRTPNPQINWSKIPIEVQSTRGPWDARVGSRTAGVSSFGLGGTNAHVIISEAPPEPEEKWTAADKEAGRQDLVLPLAISAKVPKALRDYAERFLAMLEGPEDETYYTTWRDIAHTSTVRRQHMEERLVVVGKSKDEWKEKLRAFLQGEETVPGIAKGNGKEAKGRVVFVFPGQGAQWLGMGKSLLQNNAAFKAEITRIEKAFGKHVDWKLTEELLNPKQERFEKLDIIQPLLFAMAAGIAASLKALGVEPSAVVGHSQGEVAAAYVAGGLSLEDAALIICLRSKLVEKTRGSGHMLVTGLSMTEADAEIVRFDGAISIAASNGPSTTILSGDATAVETLAAELEKKSVFVRLLKVGYASHSRQMEPLKEELLKGLASLSSKTPEKRFSSTALPDAKNAPTLDAAYWWQNLRNPVRFYDRVKALSEDGYDLFLEISPHPGLTSSIQDTLAALKANTSVALSSLRKNENENEGLLATFASLHTNGFPVDWKKAFQSKDGNYVWGRVAELPNYPWQRQRYWLPEKKEKKSHQKSKWPFIHSHVESSEVHGKHIFQVELDLADSQYAYLKDHKVQGNIWFPGAGYIEMALEVGTELLANKFSGIADLVLKESMVLSETEPTLVQLITSSPNDKGAHPFVVASKQKNDPDAPWTTHATGLLAVERLTPGDMPRLQDVRTRLKQAGAQEKPSQEIYAAFQDIDISYGPAFQGLLSVSSAKEEALAKLKTPEALQASSLDDYRAHPGLLDAAFQASIGAISTVNKLEQTFVPATVQHIRTVQNTGGDVALAFAKLRSSDPKNLSVDVYLLDKDGKLLTEVIGLGLKPIGQAQDKLDKWMWDITWKSVPQGTSEDLHGPWLLLEDSGSVGKELRALLEKKNQKVVSFPANFTDPDAYLELFKKHFPSAPPKKIVHLAALDAVEGLSLDACKQGEERGSLTALFLVQALQKMQGAAWGSASPKLFLVTKGAQPPVSSPAQAMLWGFGACVPHEMPELESVLIDLATSSSTEQLLTELTHHDSENRIALRPSTGAGNNERKVQRLGRHQKQARVLNLLRSSLTVSNSLGYRLDPTQKGDINSLALWPLDVPTPGPGQVLVRTEASALNFRDVLVVMGLPAGEAPMGSESAGTVMMVGEGVSDLLPGDEVIALCTYAFNSHVVVDARLIVKRPKSLSVEQACAVPLVYMTTVYALRDYGRLSKGETILIHAATGGVGIAAVQYAKHVGATILATAGSEEKRNYLRSLGIEHVFDSRSFDWVDGALKATGGKGVDVILNSLASEAIPKGLSILAPFGRFLELGKRDIYEHGAIDTFPMRNGISFAGVMLDILVALHPAKARALFKETLALFDTGCFSPPPITAFPVSKAADAFFFLQRAKQIGKVILTHESVVETVSSSASPVPADKTVLITGGYGGLGPVIARKLAELGVKHIALVGRSGASAETQKKLDSISAEFGTQFYSLKGDISSKVDTERLQQDLETLRAPQVHTLVHAAVTLFDATLPNQTPALFRRAFEAKIDGFLHLLASFSLKKVIFFSSASGLLGNGGQSNYASANAVLDASADFMQRQGISALSLDWGAWAEVGAATSSVISANMARNGILQMSPAEGARMFELSLSATTPQLAPFAYSPSAAEQGAGFSIFRDVFTRSESSGTLQERIASLPESQRQAYVGIEIRKLVATLVRGSLENVPASANLKDLGFDSLLMVSLKNKLHAELGITLSTAKLYAFRTLEELAAHCVPAPIAREPELAAIKTEEIAPTEVPMNEALSEDDDLLTRLRSALGGGQ